MTKEAVEEKLINYALSTASSNVINSLDVTNYPVLAIIPSGQHVWRSETTTFSLDLLYIDRLTDASDNELNIHSTGIEELKHYINRMRELEWVIGTDSEVYIEGFTETESKSDRCAGAIARIRITVLNYSPCYED